uniref:Phosphatidate cytidylyltransferase, mitochondrial n=1 Tax=Lotharella oceanica TaxID=641309 RepID=A0A7S2TIB0_9EUKA|mmetsp:Transcript_15384/g.29223  ORF Transcript_15384/g.29223 Transcript_15384/m.29223 type:complete len:245 (+) Transcript_15384:33-767(+)
MVKSALARILQRFPHCDFACAYGSAVFKQRGYYANGSPASRSSPSSPPMLDIIIGVEDAERWHNENMSRNPEDYTWPLSWFSGRGVKRFQETGGAHMVYHPYIPIRAGEGERREESEDEGERKQLQQRRKQQQKQQRQQPFTMLKYGVISMCDLLDDLGSWTTLYCSGRLQKPVVLLSTTEQVNERLEDNRRSALLCAILSLGPSFTERELFHHITALSYAGDPRFLIGAENKNKASSTEHYLK